MLQRRDMHNVLEIVNSFIVLILGKDGIYKGLPYAFLERRELFAYYNTYYDYRDYYII